jgi:DNA-binding FrmR family transcriptional regulator
MEDKHIEKLEHRLNRISGQMEGIKKRIHSGEDDCVQTLQQLKAVINGLKKFGEAYVHSHMGECLKNKMTKQEDLETALKEIVSTAFSL